ncbi:ABC transporter ATP-binding protein [Anaerobium acetethylicum]|uniref:ABC-2 type transport system ATP-binding protein n=1 Tax=Anaerobium acetethylicum TaxID=1619234 RepID=A0A1D3TQI8_9FIRM|nr:ABC transporter ATP-binding protein [Anaerobium acetethylicum]SCP95777.1 ABC-2 type transport system ATP-binding protein [Anaerobium acetethylicum]
MADAVEIRGLTKYYGKSRGIIDVSFNIEEGEIFGFIGPNGAGKSTTIRVMLALLYPDSGSAKIFGLDCMKQSREIAKRVGYLPSEVFYYEGMKVRELLNYSASFYKKDCSKRIKDLSDRMNLDLNKKIDELSFGNKKKVGIVQGLLHSPDLIILDEPTSGLDPLMQQTFFELIREENKRGAAVLMSSHILGEVQRLCDRVAIIKEGRIIKVEKISTLKENSVRRFKFEVESSIPEDYFAMEGVDGLKVAGNVHSFIYRGDVNRIIKKLSAVELVNLWAEEPDLEEIFLHYYSEGV